MSQPHVLNFQGFVTPGQSRYGPVSGVAIGVLALTASDPTDVTNANIIYATVWPTTGVLSKLYVYMATDVGLLGNMSITFRKNGAAELLSVTGGSGNTGNPVLLSNLSDTVNVTAGDLLCLEISVDPASDSGTTFILGFDFNPS